jgi:hypothetical protein
MQLMEAAHTSETTVDNYFTRQYIPEDNSGLLSIPFWRIPDYRQTGSHDGTVLASRRYRRRIVEFCYERVAHLFTYTVSMFVNGIYFLSITFYIHFHCNESDRNEL